MGHRVGTTSIGVGAFIMAVGLVFIFLTFFGVTPNQSWIFSWLTNYLAAGAGILIGTILLGYGVYTRKVLGSYVRKVEKLSDVKAKQAQRLRQKSMALKETKANLKMKEVSLRHTKGELGKVRKVAERRKSQIHKVSGKLGDRSKRLKRIEELVTVKKKSK